MKSAPTEATRETNSPDLSLGLTSRGQFSVAWPSVDRTGETAAVPLEKNFAERAVATVANLVDTQFTASMQKSGSVQLRLKFGGEDLSVRVELRGGAVHTIFAPIPPSSGPRSTASGRPSPASRPTSSASSSSRCSCPRRRTVTGSPRLPASSRRLRSKTSRSSATRAPATRTRSPSPGARSSAKPSRPKPRLPALRRFCPPPSVSPPSPEQNK